MKEIICTCSFVIKGIQCTRKLLVVFECLKDCDFTSEPAYLAGIRGQLACFKRFQRHLTVLKGKHIWFGLLRLVLTAKLRLPGAHSTQLFSCSFTQFLTMRAYPCPHTMAQLSLKFYVTIIMCCDQCHRPTIVLCDNHHVL